MRTDEILKLIGPTTAGANPLLQGAALFMANKNRGVHETNTASQRQLLADIRNQTISTRETYQHPASGKQVVRKPGPLTAVEVAWLQGLPRDPTQVSIEDAKVLYAMAHTAGGATSPDGRLVHQVLDPVAAHHDAKAADVRVRNAHAPLPDVPSSALGALADAVLAENDQLHPEEALVRASTLIADARADRMAARNTEIDRAERAAMVINAHELSRTAVSG